MSRILVISHDKVGPSMAGPGIRYHHIATTLSRDHDVTLAVFNPAYIEGLRDTAYKAVDINVHDFQHIFASFDVIVALWLSDEMIRFAKSKGIKLVFDLYAPVPVEDLVQRVFGGKVASDSDYDYVTMLDNYRHFINNADFILCSNIQQRDFWIGYAFSGHKTKPSLQEKRDIDTFFGICPMGIDTNESKNIKKDLLSQHIKLSKDDFVTVWTGGIWDWFDALTPIEAVGRIVSSGNDRLKLVFLGTKHPNDEVPAMQETDRARALAKSLSLLDKNIFFLDGWLPYDDRTKYLKRADLAIFAHKPSVEARFSHRTRVLDHILMSIPTLATEGDYLSTYLQERGMGVCVPPLDADKFTQTLGKLAADPKQLLAMRRAMEKHRSDFEWDRTLADLTAFLSSDYKTEPFRDRVHGQIDVSRNPVARAVKRRTPNWIKKPIKKIVGRKV